MARWLASAFAAVWLACGGGGEGPSPQPQPGDPPPTGQPPTAAPPAPPPPPATTPPANPPAAPGPTPAPGPTGGATQWLEVHADASPSAALLRDGDVGVVRQIRRRDASTGRPADVTVLQRFRADGTLRWERRYPFTEVPGDGLVALGDGFLAYGHTDPHYDDVADPTTVAVRVGAGGEVGSRFPVCDDCAFSFRSGPLGNVLLHRENGAGGGDYGLYLVTADRGPDLVHAGADPIPAGLDGLGNVVAALRAADGSQELVKSDLRGDVTWHRPLEADVRSIDFSGRGTVVLLASGPGTWGDAPLPAGQWLLVAESEGTPRFARALSGADFEWLTVVPSGEAVLLRPSSASCGVEAQAWNLAGDRLWSRAVEERECEPLVWSAAGTPGPCGDADDAGIVVSRHTAGVDRRGGVVLRLQP